MAIKLEAKKIAIKNKVIKAAVNPILAKKREAILLKEIYFLEKNMSIYKVERKENWKKFKNKMEIDINIIKKSIHELTHPIE